MNLRNENGLLESGFEQQGGGFSVEVFVVGSIKAPTFPAQRTPSTNRRLISSAEKKERQIRERGKLRRGRSMAIIEKRYPLLHPPCGSEDSLEGKNPEAERGKNNAVEKGLSLQRPERVVPGDP